MTQNMVSNRTDAKNESDQKLDAKTRSIYETLQINTQKYAFMLLVFSFNFLLLIILVVGSLVVAMTTDCRNACDFCRCCHNKNSAKKLFEIMYEFENSI